MNQENFDRINNDAIENTDTANWLIEKTYYQLGTGLIAVISMAVYPIIFQLNGMDFKGDGISFGPTIVAVLMGAVLVFAWMQRFKSDRTNMAEFKKSQLKNMTALAAALTKVNAENGLGAVEVDTSLKTPQLVLLPA